MASGASEGATASGATERATSSGATEEITALVMAYAERLDLGDFAGVGRLFAHATYRAQVPGGQIVEHRGPDAVAATLAGMVRTYDGIPSTKHVITNLVIDVDDKAGTATSRSYFTVLQACEGLRLQVVIAGRYHDAFERAGGAWRFTDRLILSDLFGDLSHHLTGSPF